MRSHVNITYLHDTPHPISVNGEVWAYVNSLGSHVLLQCLFQERELSCICVVCVSIVLIAILLDTTPSVTSCQLHFPQA